MRTKIYYLIRPLPALKDILPGMDTLSRESLSKSYLWESEEGGKSLWTERDYMMRAKLAFMINLRDEYLLSSGVASIFSGQAISPRLFDSFWHVERLPLAGDVKEVEGGGLDPSLFESTDSILINEWLQKKITT